MQQKISTIIATLLVVISLQSYAQIDTSKKCFVGSSMIMLANLLPEDGPDFVQLNFGFLINPRNSVSLELQTWKYAWSLGIPFGDHFDAPEEKFPGYIREFGFTFVYQHYWWKGLYTGIHVMNAFQTFVNNQNIKIDKGFQIFNTYRIGYHFSFCKNRLFIEPSIAITHRLYHTKMPDSFRILDQKWSKFFFGEPGLHFGVNF